jgi:hypothetical protein
MKSDSYAGPALALERWEANEMTSGPFDGATVFSTTMPRGRENLGERITMWLVGHPDLVPVDTVVAQSSGREFHCVTVVVFWRTVR